MARRRSNTPPLLLKLIYLTIMLSCIFIYFYRVDVTGGLHAMRHTAATPTDAKAAQKRVRLVRLPERFNKQLEPIHGRRLGVTAVKLEKTKEGAWVANKRSEGGHNRKALKEDAAAQGIPFELEVNRMKILPEKQRTLAEKCNAKKEAIAMLK